VPTIAAALVFMVLIGCINFYGISESVRINVILTCVEITGLVLIVVIGAAAQLATSRSLQPRPEYFNRVGRSGTVRQDSGDGLSEGR